MAFTLEAVAGTENDSAIRISRETQRACFTDTMLINRLFGKVHGFDTDIKVIVDGITDTGIELAPV
jgi:hypothetical protein